MIQTTEREREGDRQRRRQTDTQRQTHTETDKNRQTETECSLDAKNRGSRPPEHRRLAGGSQRVPVFTPSLFAGVGQASSRLRNGGFWTWVCHFLHVSSICWSVGAQTPRRRLLKRVAATVKGVDGDRRKRSGGWVILIRRLNCGIRSVGAR